MCTTPTVVCTDHIKVCTKLQKVCADMCAQCAQYAQGYQQMLFYRFLLLLILSFLGMLK
jgi:predicted nucleic acid-binding Zn ribbon protein